jgi:membrane dipeptidase
MIVDTHNDLLTELAFRHREPTPFSTYWRDQLRDGGVALQVCPVYPAPEHSPEGTLRNALHQVNAFHRAVRESQGSIVSVTRRADLMNLDPETRLGMMLSMEGVEPLGSDPELIELFWQLGVRLVALTWNTRNYFADGAGEPGDGGLGRLGDELVERLVGLGAILDVAHASRRTFYGLIEAAGDTLVICSHGGCRAVHETSRNLDDEQLKVLAERGGVMGLMAHPLAVDPDRPTLGRYIDHIEHAVSVMGIDHVGIGADFIRQVATSGAIPDPGRAFLPPGVSLADAIKNFEGPRGYPALTEGLERRGYSKDEQLAILGGNFLRVFATALPA